MGERVCCRPGLVTWAALVLVAGAGAFVFACLGRTPPPPGAAGDLIYELQNCANCHAEDGAGGSRGPSLESLGERWTRDELVSFLGDPEAYAETDERLKLVRARYSGEMSRYDNLTVEQRGVLAEWLLSEFE